MLKSILKDLIAAPQRTQAEPALQPLPQLVHERGGLVVAFVPPSQGDALKQHTLEMTEPLRGRCTGVEVIDFRDHDATQRLHAVARRPIWFALAPFGGGEYFRGPDDAVTSPWSQAGIPFVRLFGDVPAYFPTRHLQHFPNSINAYGHAEHMDYFVRWFTPRAPVLAQPLFPFDRIERTDVKLQEKATGAFVVFPKNGNSPEALRAYWRSSLPASLDAVLQSSSEEALANLDEPFDVAAAVTGAFSRLSIDLRGAPRLFHFLVAQLDDFQRRAKSTMIARALLDLPVTIRGINWEHLNFDGRRAKYDANSDYGSTRELLDRAVAVVDMSPNTHRGAHDRVLRASGRYTAFLTNRTRFYVDGFPDAEQFTFRFTPDAIRECVERAVAHPAETVEMGLRQAERMRELLTEQHYVEQLVAAVDACALAIGDRPPGTQNFVDFNVLPQA